MKSRLIAFGFLIVFIGALILMAMPGCTADQLASADKTIGGTPLQPTTIVTPSTNPSSPPVVTTVQPTTQQVLIHFVGDAAGEAAPIVTAAAPQPWGAIAGAALGLIASAVAVYQTVGKNYANATIANAAPAVVTAFTPELIAAAPALAALVSHPSAANAIAAMTAAATVGTVKNQAG